MRPRLILFTLLFVVPACNGHRNTGETVLVTPMAGAAATTAASGDFPAAPSTSVAPGAGASTPGSSRVSGNSASTEPTSGGAASSAGTSGQAAAYLPYDFTAAQREQVQALLALHPEWRVAATSDNESGLLERLLTDRPGYHPYFLQADLTSDGINDFAVVLTRGGEEFALYWFQGTGQGFDQPELLGQFDWLETGGISFDRGTLEAGKFYADPMEAWRWSPGQGRLMELRIDAPGIR